MAASGLAQIETAWNVAFALEIAIWILSAVTTFLRLLPKIKSRRDLNLAEIGIIVAFVVTGLAVSRSSY